MNLKILYKDIKKALQKAGIPSYELDARLIVQYCLNMSREDFILKSDDSVSDQDKMHVESIVQQRLQHKPLAKIFGVKEFCELDFKTTEDTLDPRPDSEILIEAVLGHCEDRSYPYRILDIGTGTGCLIISLLTELLGAQGVAIDISDKALDVARENSALHEVQDRLVFQNIGWNDFVSKNTFDIVISNPPYISEDEKEDLSPEVLNFDPHIALFAKDQGLKPYQEIAVRLPDLLKDQNSFAAFEFGYSQASAVSDILQQNGHQYCRVYQDLSGHDRCVVTKSG